MTTPIPLLADEEMHLGADPRLLHDELLVSIRDAMRAHPRSQQKAIGPSELGTPCLRKMAYRLAGVEASQGSESWLATVGVGVHAWLAEQMALANMRMGFSRYLIEHRVTVGTIGGVDVTGTCDLYDRITATVIDWKIVGKTRLQRARSRTADPLGRGYRVQTNLYALGYRRRGLPVQRVAVAFLPRNGPLNEAVFVTEEHDEVIALEALALADNLMSALLSVGLDLLRHLPTANDYCLSCPWFAPYSTDPTVACAGHKITTDPSEIAEGIIMPDR